MGSSLANLTASETLGLIAKRKVSVVEVITACLARIAEREPLVGAWKHLDPERALAEARLLDNGKVSGVLYGIPFGAKDIIDTASMPTAYGSSIFQGHQPEKNAVCIDRLTGNGAIMLGKTVTTEFANRHPGKTANPHNLRHTPGGSSSGSAAAVADCMVPMALAVQTTGSIIRPADSAEYSATNPLMRHSTFPVFNHSPVRSTPWASCVGASPISSCSDPCWKGGSNGRWICMPALRPNSQFAAHRYGDMPRSPRSLYWKMYPRYSRRSASLSPATLIGILN